MQLVICGVHDADRILSSSNHGIQAVISILDPECRTFLRPSGLHTVEHTLEIDFDDVEVENESYRYPTMQDAQDIVEFITSTLSKSNHDSWLIHCHQGISRSTACGLLLCALTYGLDDARHQLLSVRPRAAPNTLICEHFDKICGFDGKFAKISWDFDYQLLKKIAQAKSISEDK